MNLEQTKELENHGKNIKELLSKYGEKHNINIMCITSYATEKSLSIDKETIVTGGFVQYIGDGKYEPNLFQNLMKIITLHAKNFFYRSVGNEFLN